MASKTKLRANQVNIREILSHPDAVATTERKGTVEFATQAEVLAGSPIGVVVTTDTLKNHPGLDELKDMYVTSGSPSDTLHSDKLLFNLEVNASNVFSSEQIPDYGYDAASLAYASLTTTFSPPTASNDMESIYIRPDGTYVYIVDRVSSPGVIREFPLSTPWDISSRGTNSANYTMSSGDHINAMQGIWFNDEGTKAIVSGQSDWAEYSFATPWDIANATFVQVITDLGESTGSTPLTFSKDGLHAYRTRRAFSANQWYVTEYQLGTAWNLSTISMVSDANEITADMSVTNNAAGCAINHDGTKLFVAYDNVTDTEVMEYTLSTPYAVSSRTLVARANLTQSRFLAYPFWSQDGTDLYLLNDRIAYQYTSSAVDVGGLTTTLYHDGSERLGTRNAGVEVTGILELSGTNAQLLLPNYTTAGLPTTKYKGGVLYDTDDVRLKYYAGSPAGWVNTGLQHIVEDTTPQLGGNLDVNDFSLVGKPAAGATSNGGNVVVAAAVGGATSGTGGNVDVDAGNGGTSGYGGNITINAGNHGSSANYGGSVLIAAGEGWAGNGGYLNLPQTGAATSGDVTLSTGAGNTGYSSGYMTLKTANGYGGGGGSGTMVIRTGSSAAASSGSVTINSGTASQTAGNIQLTCGNGGTGNGGDILLRPGISSSAADGHILLRRNNTGDPIQLQFHDSDNSNYVALLAPSAVTTSRTWTLPVDDPAALGAGSPSGAYFLTTDNTGALSFAAVAGGVTNPLTADLDVDGFNIVGATTGNPAIISLPDPADTTSSLEITGRNFAGGSLSANVTITAGEATSANAAGDILLTGGLNPIGTGDAGHAVLSGGESNTSGDAGNATVIGGRKRSLADSSGNAILEGGPGQTSASGGNAIVRGGVTSSSSGSTSHGSVIIRAHDYVANTIPSEGKIIFEAGRTSGGEGTIEFHSGVNGTGQAEIQLWNDTDSGHTTGNYVAITVPNPIGSPSAANWTLTLPPDDGTPDQVLITDGSGNTSWSANATSVLYSDATQIGSDLNISGSFQSIEAFTSTDIVHVNFEVDSLQTYRFDGSTWSTVGTAYDLGTIIPFSHCMGALNSTDVAVANFSAGTIQTYRFDVSGSPAATWAPVGGTYSISGIETGLVMIALNSTDVVYYNQTSDNIRTLRFTGGSPSGTWSQVGNTYSFTNNLNSMARLNDTDIVVLDSTADTIQTYTFDGTNWSPVGDSYDMTPFEGNTNAGTITQLTSTDIVYIDATADTFSTFRFNGATWKNLHTDSTPITNVGSFISMSTLKGTTDVAFIDPTNDDLRTYRFGEIVGSQEFTTFLDDRFVNVDESEIKITSVSETSIPYGTTGAQSLDLATGTYFYPTATAGSPAITFSFTNVGSGSPSTRVYSFTLELLGAGDFAPTWPSGVKWPGGTEPTWTAVAGSPVVNGPDVVSFVTRDGGTTWLGMLGGLAFK